MSDKKSENGPKMAQKAVGPTLETHFLMYEPPFHQKVKRGAGETAFWPFSHVGGHKPSLQHLRENSLYSRNFCPKSEKSPRERLVRRNISQNSPQSGPPFFKKKWKKWPKNQKNFSQAQNRKTWLFQYIYTTPPTPRPCFNSTQTERCQNQRSISRFSKKLKFWPQNQQGSNADFGVLAQNRVTLSENFHFFKFWPKKCQKPTGTPFLGSPKMTPKMAKKGQKGPFLAVWRQKSRQNEKVTKNHLR